MHYHDVTVTYFFFVQQTSEISCSQRRVSELQTRVQELEDALARCQKDLAKERDVTSKLQRDLKENNAQKLDQVRRRLVQFGPP